MIVLIANRSGSLTGRQFATAPIERGVPRADERYEVAIPSMADWLAGPVPPTDRRGEAG